MFQRTTAPTPTKPGRWVITKFGPPSVLDWQVYETLPQPAENEVLIRILVAGVSGTDNLQRVGGYPDPRTQKPGFTPGYDLVGIVEAVGSTTASELAGISIGSLVASMCCLGSYATHIVLPLPELIKIKDDDNPIMVAALPLNYMTAYGMLMRSKASLERGSTILIGSVSGGVGTAMAQLVHSLDLGYTLLGTCSLGKFDYVKSLGVTPIDRHGADIPGKVRQLTGGEGVDVAFDMVGSNKSLEDSMAATKGGTGRVIVIGIMSAINPSGEGMDPKGFDIFTYIAGRPQLSFFSVIADYYYPKKDLWLQDFHVILQAVRDGKLKPFVGQLFKLSDAVVVNEQLVSGTSVMGKLEMVVDAVLANSNGL